MELGLENKKVLISASMNGIGLATAKEFLNEGASVWINGRNRDHVIEVSSRLKKAYGSEKVKYFIGDASEDDAVKQWMMEVEKEWKSVDVLIPNLGTGKPICEDKLDIREWEHMMNLNLYSAIRLIKAGYPLLKEGVHPCIILLSSIVAYERAAAPCAYAAAKASVLSLIQYLSEEFAKDQVRVNGVAPGNIYFKGGRWEELLKTDEERVQEYIEMNVPLGRFGMPEEIAALIAFLASERSLFTTGSAMVVDGGQKRGS